MGGLLDDDDIFGADAYSGQYVYSLCCSGGDNNFFGVGANSSFKSEVSGESFS